jgi:5-bromo-4-chloroindolyl phosphate hydrolysis protein
MSSVSQKQIGLYERAERAEREARYAKNSSEEAKTKLSALQKRYDKLVVSILKLKALARAEE